VNQSRFNFYKESEAAARLLRGLASPSVGHDIVKVYVIDLRISLEKSTRCRTKGADRICGSFTRSSLFEARPDTAENGRTDLESRLVKRSTVQTRITADIKKLSGV
jgi:hypothetical protein